jgi:uncharacterized protein (UPF0333 family)
MKKTKRKYGQAMIEYIIVFSVLFVSIVTALTFFIRATNRSAENSRILVTAQDP